MVIRVYRDFCKLYEICHLCSSNDHCKGTINNMKDCQEENEYVELMQCFNGYKRLKSLIK